MLGYLVTFSTAYEIMEELSPKRVYRLARIHIPHILESNMNVPSGVLRHIFVPHGAFFYHWFSGTLWGEHNIYAKHFSQAENGFLVEASVSCLTQRLWLGNAYDEKPPPPIYCDQRVL